MHQYASDCWPRSNWLERLHGNNYSDFRLVDILPTCILQRDLTSNLLHSHPHTLPDFLSAIRPQPIISHTFAFTIYDCMLLKSKLSYSLVLECWEATIREKNFMLNQTNCKVGKWQNECLLINTCRCRKIGRLSFKRL